jgi:hypothetical protein
MELFRCAQHQEKRRHEGPQRSQRREQRKQRERQREIQKKSKPEEYLEVGRRREVLKGWAARRATKGENAEYST